MQIQAIFVRNKGRARSHQTTLLVRANHPPARAAFSHTRAWPRCPRSSRPPSSPASPPSRRRRSKYVCVCDSCVIRAIRASRRALWVE